MTRRGAIPLIAVLFGLSGPMAESRPLEAEVCSKLKADLAALDQTGVREMLDKGPEAAKGAGRDQIRQVRQYLDLLGQVRFRCPLDSPLVTLRPEPPDDPAEAAAAGAPIEAGSPGITLPPGVAAATVAPAVPKAPTVPKVKVVPKKVAVVPAAGAPSAAAAAPPIARPAKAKAKPKVDDALRPAAPAAQVAPAVPAAPPKAP